MKIHNATSASVLLILLLLFFPQGLSGQVIISDEWETEFVENDLLILPMSSDTEFKVNDVIYGQLDEKFEPFDFRLINGVETFSWQKLRVENKSTKLQNLFVGTTRYEEISFWIKSDVGVVGPIMNGQDLSIDLKQVQVEGLSFFKFSLESEQSVDLFFKVANRHSSIIPKQVIPMVLATEKYFDDNFERPGAYTYLFLGAVGIMFAFNLLLYLSTRLKVYLYYSLYVIFVAIFAIGLIPQFAYPLYGHMDINQFPISSAGAISALFYAFVAQEIMEINRYYPRVNKLLKVLMGTLVISVATSIFEPLNTLTSILNFGAASIVFPMIFVIGFFMTLKKHLPSQFFFIAIVFFFIGVTVLMLSFTNLIHPIVLGVPSVSIYQGCITVELALFSLGISVRFNEMKDLKIREETERSLLLNTLPESTVNELMIYGKVKPRLYEETTILFLDIVGFTQHAETLSPENLIKQLDHYYKNFDLIAEKNNIEKIKTIGDAYLAICGVPEIDPNHAHNVINGALEILDFVERESKKEQEENRAHFDIRIGVHSGSVIAGMVGVSKFAFDIWGDSVNIASRIEHQSEAGKINVSKSTYELIKNDFTCTPRGKIEVKNKGKIEMFFVNKKMERPI